MNRLVLAGLLAAAELLTASTALAALPSCLWVADATQTARLLDIASGEELASIAGFTSRHAAMLDDSCELWAVADDGVTLSHYSAAGDVVSTENLAAPVSGAALTPSQTVGQLLLTPHPVSGFRTTLHDSVKLLGREANAAFASFTTTASPVAVTTAADTGANGAGYWVLSSAALSYIGETGAAGPTYSLGGQLAAPATLAVDPIRNHAWIGGGDGVLIVDLAAGQIVRKIPLAQAVQAMAWDNRNGIAWVRTVPSANTHTIASYGLDGTQLGSIEVATGGSTPSFAVLPTSHLAVGRPEGLLLYSPQGDLLGSYLGGSEISVLAAPPLVPKPSTAITQPTGVSQGGSFEVQVETLCAGDPCGLPADRQAAREAAYGIGSSTIAAGTLCSVPLTRNASTFSGSWPSGCAIGDGDISFQASFNGRPLTGSEPNPALYQAQLVQAFLRDTTAPVISNLSPADGTILKREDPVVPLSGNLDDPSGITVLENAGAWQAAEANPQSGTAFLWNLTLQPGVNTAALTSFDPAGNSRAAQTSVTYIPVGTSTWRFTVASAGQYDVTARWIGQGSPATVVYRIQHADGTGVVTVSPSATGTLALGSYRFLPGVNYAVSLDSAEGTGVAVADAVSLTPQEAGFNIYPDQLGTPRVITDANGQEVWRWALDDPFGPNPAVGSIEMPLRFPGQVRDSETGMHYNVFRDYDPETGRYIESDPIGLWGGLNTYSYVEQDPLRFIDPLGLAPKGTSFSSPDVKAFKDRMDRADVSSDVGVGMRGLACMLGHYLKNDGMKNSCMPRKCKVWACTPKCGEVYYLYRIGPHSIRDPDTKCKCADYDLDVTSPTDNGL